MTEKEQQSEAAEIEDADTQADVSSETPESVEKPAPRPADALARVLAFLALVLAGSALAGGYYLWQQAQKTVRQDAFATMQQSVAQQSKANQNRLAELAAALQKQQREDQQLQAAIAQLEGRLGRNHSDWVVAEVEYLLSIANQRVQLQRDVATAIKAFSIADQLLQNLANPMWYPVRQQISNEITALRAVPQIDRAGIASKLVSLSDKVAQLPVVDTERDSPIKDTLAKQDKALQKPNWQTRVKEFAWAVWQELKGLVRVRQTNEQIKPLLAPVSQQFLIQNLKLQLQSARLAVQQDEAVIYQQSLQTASDWIKLYFDTDSAVTKSMLEALAELARVQLAPELPDVSGSLLTLRKLRDSQSEVVNQATDNKDKQ